MAGRQAKLLSDAMFDRALRLLTSSRYPERNRVMLLLSFKAGLRANEIAGLTWAMVQRADGQLSHCLEVEDHIAKNHRGRRIPMHRDLRKALRELKAHDRPNTHDTVLRSERGASLNSASVVNWFADFYRTHGFAGCSSHSGRRTFITKAAREISRCGGSLRDVQELAGHASLRMTERYIEGDRQTQRRLVARL